MKTNQEKYGKKNDVIAQSLESSADFCYYSALKYATRLKKVSEMWFLKRLYYRLILCKGHRKKDYFKMIDFIERMKVKYPFRAKVCYEECEKIMING